MDLEHILLREMSQIEKETNSVRSPFTYGILRKDQFIKTDSKMVATRGMEGGKIGLMLFQGTTLQ